MALTAVTVVRSVCFAKGTSPAVATVDLELTSLHEIHEFELLLCALEFQVPGQSVEQLGLGDDAHQLALTSQHGDVTNLVRFDLAQGFVDGRAVLNANQRGRHDVSRKFVPVVARLENVVQHLCEISFANDSGRVLFGGDDTAREVFGAHPANRFAQWGHDVDGEKLLTHHLFDQDARIAVRD